MQYIRISAALGGKQINNINWTFVWWVKQSLDARMEAEFPTVAAKAFIVEKMTPEMN